MLKRSTVPGLIDEIPILAVVVAMAQGTSVVSGASPTLYVQLTQACGWADPPTAVAHRHADRDPARALRPPKEAHTPQLWWR